MKRILNKLFRVGKQEAAPQSFLRLILPSVLVLAFSTVFFVSMTWAWFTSSVAVDAGTITSGNFYIGELSVTEYQYVLHTEPPSPDASAEAASVKEPESATGIDAFVLEPTEIEVTDNQFTAKAGVKYEISLKTAGSASGYCEIATPDGTYYTNSSTITFTMILEQSGSVTLTAYWGTTYEETIKDSIGTGEEVVPKILEEDVDPSTADTPVKQEPTAPPQPEDESPATDTPSEALPEPEPDEEIPEPEPIPPSQEPTETETDELKEDVSEQEITE